MMKSQRLWRTLTVLVRLDIAIGIAVTAALLVALAGR